MNITLNTQQQRAYNLILQGKNIFITGGGGVGKSTFIKYIYQNLKGNKKIVCTSTTGTSAILINGTTLHSYLGIGLGTAKVDSLIRKIRSRPFLKKKWLEVDILVIDEVSMLNPELFDKIESIARTIRRSSLIRRESVPFGGIQLVLSGDFCQLPCVNSENFCFEAQSWNSCIHETVYLTEIIRQKDMQFQQCLREIRLGNVSANTKQIINSRINAKLKNELGIKPTKLYPRNFQVQKLNDRKISKLIEKNGEIYEYPIEYVLKNKKIKMEHLKKKSMAVENLQLTTNCQVMLICNLDIENELVNGSRGIVTGFSNDLPIVQFLNGTVRTIEHHKWEVHDNELAMGEIHQLPLKLAYAFSIHKSQGVTLDYAEIDLTNVFDYGMGYVALSRVKNLHGLSIKSGIEWDTILPHPKAQEYYHSLQEGLTIYTDGSCISEARGGYAGILLQNNEIITEISGGKLNTTNNQMELQAVIKSLEAVQDTNQEITIYTDSKYVKNGITEWIQNWKQNGWKTANRKDVLNQDLWKELDDISQDKKISWNWVKAHNGDEWNEYVDELARKTAESL